MFDETEPSSCFLESERLGEVSDVLNSFSVGALKKNMLPTAGHVTKCGYRIVFTLFFQNFPEDD